MFIANINQMKGRFSFEPLDLSKRILCACIAFIFGFYLMANFSSTSKYGTGCQITN